LNDFEKIHVGNSKEFGNQILELMNDGYLVLFVYRKDNKIFCVESYGYNENKNKDVYYHNYEPCQYYTITDNENYFVDTKFASCDFIPVYIFKESMIREARKIQKQDEETIEIYRTKSKYGADAAWGMADYFCNDWANEIGWAQEDEAGVGED
jgi:hypothetical protein